MLINQGYRRKGLWFATGQRWTTITKVTTTAATAIHTYSTLQKHYINSIQYTSNTTYNNNINYLYLSPILLTYILKQQYVHMKKIM